MDREYYTYGEIVLALRKYYQEMQKKLNEMKEKIVVETKEPSTYELELQLESEPIELSNGDVIQGPYIKLHISKNFLANLSAYSYKISRNMTQYFKNNVCYKMIENDGKCSFDYIEKYYPWAYKAHAYVPDELQADFVKIYQEFKEIPLYNTKQAIIDINPFQSLWFTGNELYLHNDFRKHSIYLGYETKDDKIHIEAKEKQHFFFLEDLLETQIPLYLIPNDLRELIKSNYREIETVSLEDDVKKEAIFDFEYKNDDMVFKKIKK